MSTYFPSRAARLLVGLLVTMSVLVHSPSIGTAETSAHKLKKRLHRAERGTGRALSNIGEVMAGTATGFAEHVSVGSCEDDDVPSWPLSPTIDKARPKSVPPSHPVKPSKNAHPAK